MTDILEKLVVVVCSRSLLTPHSVRYSLEFMIARMFALGSIGNELHEFSTFGLSENFINHLLHLWVVFKKHLSCRLS